MRKIFDANKLSLEALNKLVEKKIGVLRIKNFYQKPFCKEISNKILNSHLIRNFIKAKHVKCIGMPHFNIVNTELFDLYHSGAMSNIEEVRHIFSPFLSPIDQLRLQLDEIWTPGANIEILYGKKCFVGLCRILDSTEQISEILPHIDMLERDSPDSFRAKSLLDQFACNLYLSNFSNGGELYLWFKSPTLQEYEKQINQTNSYYVDSNILGKPDLIINPEIGDLILFSSRYYHAVAPSSGNGYRMSVSAFIGYRGYQEPLTFWS